MWQAIAAWNRALAAEPGNAEVLLSMGVSYTNEMDQGRALRFLRRWLECRLTQGGVRAVQDRACIRVRGSWLEAAAGQSAHLHFTHGDGSS